MIDVRENIEIHQLGDDLMRFQAELRRELFDDDRRLDVNDFLRFGFRLRWRSLGRSIDTNTRNLRFFGRFNFRCGRRGLVDLSWRYGRFQRRADPRDRRENGRLLF